jgi:hypothetical protein
LPYDHELIEEPAINRIGMDRVYLQRIANRLKTAGEIRTAPAPGLIPTA